VRAVAVHALHNDIGAVRFKRYAVITIVNVGVLYHNEIASKRIPAITIFGWIAALALD
jgi:hypothetical protein